MSMTSNFCKLKKKIAIGTILQLIYFTIIYILICHTSNLKTYEKT